jgi:hypothetical protein
MIGMLTTRARLPWLVAISLALIGLGLLVRFG